MDDQVESSRLLQPPPEVQCPYAVLVNQFEFILLVSPHYRVPHVFLQLESELAHTVREANANTGAHPNGGL